MDKNAIKKYAVWARRELIERVSQRAMFYGVTSEDAGNPDAAEVHGRLLSPVEKKQRQALFRNVREKGFDQVMEEVAYTWFNRFAALRFMEVNGYLPSLVRVFTNEAGEFKPQILSEALHLDLDGLDKQKVLELESGNKSEELFRYLLIVQCNALNGILPGMFQKIEDYTELLLPDNLLRDGSVIEQMVTTIPEENWTDQVQIIGWLYQYYNTEPKDKVFADLKKNIKISKEKIPAATQLFTPDWIVHYMVENSLGRLWLEGHPNDALKSEWKYYLDEAEQEPEVEAQLVEIRKEYAALKPEEIKVIDPCCGSGHILVVMFDVLVRIYEDYGYTAREAASQILENNLWGLDIDERAAQLSYFAVMMKARQYDRRFFTRKVQPHVYAIEESNGISEDDLCMLGGDLNDLDRNNALTQMSGLMQELHDAKEYGSIISVTPCDWDLLRHFNNPRQSEYVQLMLGVVDDTLLSERLTLLIDVGAALAQKYHAVVTNPPYMSTGGMNDKLQKFVKKWYPDHKSDLYAVFIKVCTDKLRNKGILGMITQHTWMFLSRYEKMRKAFELSFINMVHLGARAFDDISGEIVQTVAFTTVNAHIKSFTGTYVRVVDYNGEASKEKAFFSIGNHIYSQQDLYMSIPGSTIAYWVTQDEINAFNRGIPLAEYAIPRVGAITGNNEKFIRNWWEVKREDICDTIKSYKESEHCESKWYPYNKGGTSKAWYGNRELVVFFRHGGEDIIKNAKETGCFYFLGAQDVFFKQGITWNGLASSRNTFRFSPTGTLFDSNKGPMLFPQTIADTYYLLGLFNSKVAQKYLNILNPSISLQAGDFEKLPILISEKRDQVEHLAKECVELAKHAWDEQEISMDFQSCPLLKNANLVRICVNNYLEKIEQRKARIQINENEINEIFIETYKENELPEDTITDDISRSKREEYEAVTNIISYAVGCMFGRYSLDAPGLAYAGGEWDASKYQTFIPDADAILPICDDEYFEDDIVGRFVRFVETAYGMDTIEENLRFIADAIGGKGSSREVIRNYFINDFYADHLKTYQKRPIYWLFDSGKKNGFKCLIYMHRYQPDTIARIRTDYVHEQQSRYRTAIADLEQRVAGASPSERVKLTKQLSKVRDQAEELRVYEEKIHHLADQMIPIDLDDGVKVNYAKFQDVLAKIK